MSPRKLSDGDRQEILDLYRTTNETTSTLATRFGVSSSTISRFLKSNLSTLEYEDLIQEKRLARTANYQGDYYDNDDNSDDTDDFDNQNSEDIAEINPEKEMQLNLPLSLSFEKEEKPLIEENEQNEDDQNQEILAQAESILEQENDEKDDNQSALEQDNEIDQNNKANLVTESELNEIKMFQEVVNINEISNTEETAKTDNLNDENNYLSISNNSFDDEDDEEKNEDDSSNYYGDYDELDQIKDLESVNAIQTMFGEDADDDDDWDDDEDDEDDDEELPIIDRNPPQVAEEIKILPLSQAVFPRQCYLAVDRSSELITRPLKDFRDLGKIPPEETKQQTLPIFDNHRVAKRFCDRRGKVIKLPNGNIFKKTSTYLNAKGITRLLINGKIYSL